MYSLDYTVKLKAPNSTHITFNYVIPITWHQWVGPLFCTFNKHTQSEYNYAGYLEWTELYCSNADITNSNLPGKLLQLYEANSHSRATDSVHAAWGEGRGGERDQGGRS